MPSRPGPRCPPCASAAPGSPRTAADRSLQKESRTPAAAAGRSPFDATTVSSTTDSGNATPQNTSTGVCPSRSISRPSSGDAIAPASAWVAATAPAVAYEPVSSLTRMTMLSDIIPIGSRPMNAATSTGRTPGIASTVANRPRPVRAGVTACSASAAYSRSSRRSVSSAARSIRPLHLARRLGEPRQHVRRHDLRIGRVRPAHAHAHAPEVVAADALLDALQPVVPGDPAALAGAHLAERQVDLVVHHHQPVEVELVLPARRANRAARLVHVGLRQQHRDARHAGPDAAVGDQAAELLARARQVPALCKHVRDLEADVVTGAGVTGPRVAEAHEQEVDGRARPAAAEEAQERPSLRRRPRRSPPRPPSRGGLLALRQPPRPRRRARPLPRSRPRAPRRGSAR